MRKIKRRRISGFTNFAPEFVEDFTDDTPKDINLRNYLDDGDQRDIALTDLENELKQKENEETMCTYARKRRRMCKVEKRISFKSYGRNT